MNDPATPPDVRLTAAFTPQGWRRAVCLDKGPCFAATAVLTLEPDGSTVPVQHIPDPEPASGGTIHFIIPAPPGGGHMRSAELLAEDGVPIIQVTATPPIYLPDGGTLLVPMSLQ